MGYRNSCLDAEADPIESMSLLSRIAQVPQAWVVQQTVAIPHTQCIDRVANVPFVTQREVPTIKKTIEMPQARFIPHCGA